LGRLGRELQEEPLLIEAERLVVGHGQDSDGAIAHERDVTSEGRTAGRHGRHVVRGDAVGERYGDRMGRVLDRLDEPLEGRPGDALRGAELKRRARGLNEDRGVRAAIRAMSRRSGPAASAVVTAR
jgi:hypothetical protein